MKTVVFYNHANLGDLHISRELVKYVMQHAGADSYVYAHRHSQRVLRDIPGLEQTNDLSHYSAGVLSEAVGDEIHLNTWYAVSPVWNAGYGMGCTLNTLHELFRDHMRMWFDGNIVEPVERFLPRIDFASYNIEQVDEFFAEQAEQFRKIVFFCNGQTMSGQTRMNTDVFEDLLAQAIAANPDVLFLVTNRHEGLRFLSFNVACTDEIIGLPTDTCDLPENGYISTKCDVVVGRASGAYSFAYLADNFLDEKKTMLCFTDDERTARWVIPYNTTKARILWSADYSMESMKQLLATAIK